MCTVHHRNVPWHVSIGMDAVLVAAASRCVDNHCELAEHIHPNASAHQHQRSCRISAVSLLRFHARLDTSCT